MGDAGGPDEDVKELLGASGKGTVSLTVTPRRGKRAEATSDEGDLACVLRVRRLRAVAAGIVKLTVPLPVPPNGSLMASPIRCLPSRVA